MLPNLKSSGLIWAILWYQSGFSQKNKETTLLFQAGRNLVQCTSDLKIHEKGWRSSDCGKHSLLLSITQYYSLLSPALRGLESSRSHGKFSLMISAHQSTRWTISRDPKELQRIICVEDSSKLCDLCLVDSKPAGCCKGFWEMHFLDSQSLWHKGSREKKCMLVVLGKIMCKSFDHSASIWTHI